HKICWEGAPPRPPPPPPPHQKAAEIVERLRSYALVHHELKRRVVQRKHDAHRAIMRSLRPVAAVPALQGRTCIDEGEHGLASFEQNDILHRALSRFGCHLDLQSTRENWCQGLAINEID